MGWEVSDMAGNDFRLLTLQEIMDQFGVSRSTVDRWRKYAGMPSIKIGKEIYFHFHEVKQWIAKQRSVIPPTVEGTHRDRVVRVGYQSHTAHMWSAVLMKSLRLFEDQLARLSSAYSVEWIDAANGLDLVERMVAKKLEFASVGDYPIAIAQRIAALLPGFKPALIAFDGKSPAGKGISLIVAKEGSLPEPNELHIYSVPHSSAEYRLNRILEKRNWRANIQHQSMQQNFHYLINRQAPASVLWEPYISLFQLQSDTSYRFEEYIDEDYLTGILADFDFAQTNESIVMAYLQALLSAHKILRDYPMKAAQVISASTGFPIEVTLKIVRQVRWDASFSARDLETLRRLSLYSSSPALLEPTELAKEWFLHDASKREGLPYQDFLHLPSDWHSEPLF
jgi:NitT/TauT family transport system substrate-binding protein